MESQTPQDPSVLRSLLARWAEAWALVGLERRLEISFSSRFRTSLGRYVLGASEIRLATFLLTGPPALLREALCHEAAHAAVYELHGAAPRPHGDEWQTLMRAAGFDPRARLPANLLPDVVRDRVLCDRALRRARPERLWEHRCPVCQAMRMARRRVPRWRCAACRAAGLEGALIVTQTRNPTAPRSAP